MKSFENVFKTVGPEDEFNRWLSSNGIEIEEVCNKVFFSKKCTNDSYLIYQIDFEKRYIAFDPVSSRSTDKEFFKELKSEIIKVFGLENEWKSIPEGFNFCFKPYCSGCSDYEPEVERLYLDVEAHNTIICKNHKRCESIHHNMLKHQSKQYNEEHKT